MASAMSTGPPQTTTTTHQILSQPDIATKKLSTTTEPPTATTTKALITTTTLQPITTTAEKRAGQFAGSAKSNVYHYPNCRYIEQINPENLIWLNSINDTEARDFRACKVCQPPGFAPPTTVAQKESHRLSEANPVVHITRTGEKYHSAGCQYLSRSDIPIGLSGAKTQGYTPCSRCGPPD
jgi:methylphosphotriester-DNA--protein-cysteine methyltransferase